MDMVSGEEKTVYEGMPLYKLSTTHFVSFYDGNMVVNVTDNLSGSDHVKRYRYVFMPETGELVENTLRANISGMEDFVNIYASTDDYYLVAHNTVNYPLTLVDNAGVPYTVEASENQYALIAKADYWNSVPNYIPIVDE